MGCLQRWSENSGSDVVENFLRGAKMKKTVTVTDDGATYEFSIPNTMSEVDLIIRETFETVHGCPPDDEEVDHIFSLLGDEVVKK
jgi:coenzyme F420-reducing hydrogenase gamma subunit